MTESAVYYAGFIRAVLLFAAGFSRAVLLFAIGFSRWWVSISISLSRLQPGFHDSTTAKGISNKPCSRGFPAESGFQAGPLRPVKRTPTPFSPFQRAS